MNISKILFVLLLMFSAPCFPNVGLPAIFQDNMVLQRNAQIKIWGWAKTGEEVSIKASWSNDTIKIKTGKTAHWEAILQTPDLRGPQEISISGYNKIVLKNLLLGEVWLVSGQSNMEWTAAAGIDNAEEAIANAENPQIRFFSVDYRTADCPQQDLGGSWVSSTPQTMKYFSAVAYFFGKKLNEDLDVPIGLINASWGGTPAEVWIPAETIRNNARLTKGASVLSEGEWGPSKPGKAYNAMIAPIIPYKIAGVLWYQGESNTGNADFYEDLFSALINSWRNKWNEEFPFFYAQIAPFEYGDNYSGVKVRDAQRRVLKLPNTGMVMTSDIGDTKDIHPKNKRDVGLRFANLTLAEVYNKNIAAHAPLFDRVKIEGNRVKVFFKNAEGLFFKNKKESSQFEIAGEDKKFYPANAKIKGDAVILGSKAVKNPQYVRFSWGNTTIPRLFNAAGLPASSFTTAY